MIIVFFSLVNILIKLWTVWIFFNFVLRTILFYKQVVFRVSNTKFSVCFLIQSSTVPENIDLYVFIKYYAAKWNTIFNYNIFRLYCYKFTYYLRKCLLAVGSLFYSITCQHIIANVLVKKLVFSSCCGWVILCKNSTCIQQTKPSNNNSKVV